MAKTNAHDQALFLRCTAADLERLDALAARIAFATRSGLAREAMRIGLAAIERDPTCLLGKPLDTRGGARPGSGPKAKRKARKGTTR